MRQLTRKIPAVVRKAAALRRCAPLAITSALVLLLLSACSITIGAPAATPGPNAPTNTPIEQIHFDVTPAPTPTPVPPTPTLAPLPAGVTPGPSGTVKYTIKPGDTLSGIAQQFGITVDDIVRVNNIANPNQVEAGQVLTIPAKGAAPAPRPSATPTKAP